MRKYRKMHIGRVVSLDVLYVFYITGSKEETEPEYGYVPMKRAWLRS